MTNKVPGASVYSDMFSVLFAFGQSRGLNIDEMANIANVSVIDVVDPKKRLPDAGMQALWQRFAETDTDGTLPLNFAKAAPLTIFAGLAEGARYASTLGVALEHIVRNGVVIADRLDITIDHTNEGATIQLFHPLDYMDAGHLSSVGIFLLKRLIADVLEVPNAPARVGLRLPISAAAPAIEAFFGCEVQFDHPTNGLTISRAAYGAPINHANAELFAFVETHFDATRGALEAARWPARLQRLREAIVENALKSDYSPSAASSAANLSLRSAQRLALSEGYTLQRMIDEVRFENAKALLRNSDLRVVTIADLLGYSDDRSFRRAFHRVIGLSPTEYRKSTLR